MTTSFEVLKKSPLFSGVAYSTLTELDRLCRIKQYKSGEEIIKDGEHGSVLYLLMSGTVSVIKKLTLLDDEKFSKTDKELILLKAENNGFFGEMVLCSQTDVRSATVRSNCDCTVAELDSADIHRVFSGHPVCGTLFYRNLASLMAARLRKSNRDIVKLTTALTLALDEY